MPERLFLFLQMEFPWELGPPDGRYLLRSSAGAEPERVVVIGTLGARRRASARAQRRLSGRAGSRRGVAPPTPEPAPVATARATIVDPIPVSAERQARAWLAQFDVEREVPTAVAVLNRILHHHRIASADPYIHEVSPAQALVIVAGWGEGEQVADGRWLHARELPWPVGKRRPSGARRGSLSDRSAALRPQERLAELLSARGAALLCEDLALRARLDLDQRRLRLAAIELQAAYAAALAELRAEQRADLAIRIAELDNLRAGVAQQARAAMPAQARSALAVTDATAGRPATGDRDATSDPNATGEPDATGDPNATGDRDAVSDTVDGPTAGPREDVVRHALERLEAALRARTATGFDR